MPVLCPDPYSWPKPLMALPSPPTFFPWHSPLPQCPNTPRKWYLRCLPRPPCHRHPRATTSSLPTALLPLERAAFLPRPLLSRAVSSPALLGEVQKSPGTDCVSHSPLLLLALPQAPAVWRAGSSQHSWLAKAPRACLSDITGSSANPIQTHPHPSLQGPADN